MTETQIQIKSKNSEKEKIKAAAVRLGLGFSTFARMAALEKADSILRTSGVQQN